MAIQSRLNNIQRPCCYISRVQELCESRGGRPGLPVSKSPYGLCGRKATLNLDRVVHGQSSGAV